MNNQICSFKCDKELLDWIKNKSNSSGFCRECLQFFKQQEEDLESSSV